VPPTLEFCAAFTASLAKSTLGTSEAPWLVEANGYSSQLWPFPTCKPLHATLRLRLIVALLVRRVSAMPWPNQPAWLWIFF
jgi:hypothetical protein